MTSIWHCRCAFLPRHRSPRVHEELSTEIKCHLLTVDVSLCFSHSDGCSQMSPAVYLSEGLSLAPPPLLSSFRSRVVTEAKEEFTAEGIILNRSADGDDHLFLNHLCCIAAVFRRKARARGNQNQPSPPLTVAPEICAHSNHQEIQWGFTHMLITNLYAFLCYCWTLLSLFKPRKLNHLDTFTTDGTGWTTEKPWMCCSLHALI